MHRKLKNTINAHRVFNPEYILELFTEGEYAALTLKEFSVVTNDKTFLPNASPAQHKTDDYSCGLYHFIKLRNKKTKKNH